MTVTTEPTSTESVRRRRTPLPVAGALVVALVVAGVVAGVVVRQHRGSAAAPYQDASATGRLALCDAAGHALTSGSVKAPLTSTVVGETAIADADADGAAATLFAYQPRQGVGPGEWTGLALSAPGAVSARSVPSVSLGTGAITLAQFLGGYPAAWDGWVQLRLVVGSPEAGTLPTYDAVDLQVHGDTWRAVDPGSTSCPS